jgi:hypothetical protein
VRHRREPTELRLIRLDEEQAMETGLRVRARGRNIGDYVARLRLRPDEGFDLADTGSRGHLTIWGDSVKLAASVVDIVPLQQ